MRRPWQPATVETHSDSNGKTFQLTHEGRQVRVRFHRDGTIRLAGTRKGEQWTDERTGQAVRREHGYPVLRVRPLGPGRSW
jgi:hypothetical protein